MPAEGRVSGCQRFSSAFPNPGLEGPQQGALPEESPNGELWLRRVCTATEEGLWRATRTHTLRDRLESLWGVEGLFYVEGGQ